KPKARRIKGDPRPGDRIVLLASSGIHANGITLCREVASRSKCGYRSALADGQMFGEALITPTAIYVNFVKECLDRKIVPRYAVNITGHGWRKLMRLEAPLSYKISVLPCVPPIFRFLMENGNLGAREAYATFNMGAGFAVYV